MTPEIRRENLQAQGIWLARARGQNFLVDENMLACLAGIVVDSPERSILEIGAGAGNWTRHLAPRAKQVYALEIDRKVFSILQQETGEFSNVVSIHADVMQYNFHDFFQQHPNEQFLIAGNLPYSLSTPILFQWIELYRRLSPTPFQKIFFMVQKEVAERMTAKVGTPAYGRLSVILAYYAAVRMERMVPRQCFFPVPKVDSAFVSIHFGEGIRRSAAEDRRFEAVVQAAFGQRRKQIHNSLKRILSNSGEDSQIILNLLSSLDIEPTQRAEDIAPEDFLRIARQT